MILPFFLLFWFVWHCGVANAPDTLIDKHCWKFMRKYCCVHSIACWMKFVFFCYGRCQPVLASVCPENVWIIWKFMLSALSIVHYFYSLPIRYAVVCVRCALCLLCASESICSYRCSHIVWSVRIFGEAITQLWQCTRNMPSVCRYRAISQQ